MAQVPSLVTWRALLALYRRPRPGSALYELAKRAAGEDALWDLNAHLTAHLIDEVRVLQYMYASAHRDKKAPALPAPQRFPRPGVTAGEQGAPEGEGTTHIGYGAIPMATFEHWWTTAGKEIAA